MVYFSGDRIKSSANHSFNKNILRDLQGKFHKKSYLRETEYEFERSFFSPKELLTSKRMKRSGRMPRSSKAFA